MLATEAFATPARLLLRVLWAAAAVALLALWLRTALGRGNGLVSDVLNTGVTTIAAALCFARGALVANERAAWLTFGIALALWTTAQGTYELIVEQLDPPPYPSISDYLLISSYACSFLALLLLMRDRLDRFRPALWLDAGVAILALGAIGAALLLDPILASTGGSTAAVATTLAYPLGDLLVISVVLAVYALSGWRPGRRWAILGAAFCLQVVIDTIFLYQVANGTYTTDGLLDALWPIGMLLVAFAAWRAPEPPLTLVVEGWQILVVPSLFTVVALFLTTYDHFEPVNDVAAILATATLVIAFFRAATGFANLRSVSRTRDLLARHQLILDSAGEGIWGTDADGRTIFLNQAAVQSTGYAAEEVLGERLHDLIHHTKPDGSPYPQQECPVLASVREGAVYHTRDEVYWRRDGSSFPVEYTATPITEGDEVTGAVIVFRDITERRAADKMKDEFVSVVSHELRTPLTSIRGSLGLLGGGVLGPLPENGRRMLDIALSNTDRLMRMINDILDIERIESGQVTMERRECEAGELMREAEQAVAGMAHDAEVALSLAPAEGRLWADPDRIVQVLTNLLSNAIKFSFAGGTVRLSAEQRGQELRFTVSDEGRGIPAERLESIFERFQQVDSSDSREKGGTGLGLPICRGIVAQHGGRIWAESTPDQGSTFHAELPALAPRPPTAARSPGAATSVLVCDDDDIVIEVVTTLLEPRGYRLIAARSGKEALDLAAAERPDVILLDLLMPGISGWTTIAALKERPQTTDIPIVILSALTPQEREAPLPDVADWVDKPIDAGTLLDALDNALTTPRGDVTRVAIVEDDLDLVEVMSALFEGKGIETFHAHTAAAAVELIPRVQPDLVVLDLMLPDGDGFEVAAALRRHDGLGALPLVVYTARDLSHWERERLRLGETEFLVKGRVSPQDFEQRVVGLLERITGGSTTMPQELDGDGAAALGARAHALGR